MKLPKLQRLSIQDTAVTDLSVPAMLKSKSLAAVYLGGTKISPTGRQQLRDRNITVSPAD